MQHKNDRNTPGSDLNLLSLLPRLPVFLLLLFWKQMFSSVLSGRRFFCRENERAAPCDALYVHQKWAPKAALGDGSFCPAPGCSMMGSWEMRTSLSRGESRVHRCQGPQPTFPGGLNKLHPPHLPSGTSPDPLSLSLPPHKHSHTHFL